MTATAFEREKQEVEAVLTSGIFSRAPNIALLLKYVCRKYFEGAAADIKEYNIAVDAFGRPAEFDQKRDSIVRVEAHRLRKRLREYYEGEGAAHAVHIEIPSGQYSPRFVFVAETQLAVSGPAEPEPLCDAPGTSLIQNPETPNPGDVQVIADPAHLIPAGRRRIQSLLNCRTGAGRRRGTPVLHRA